MLKLNVSQLVNSTPKTCHLTSFICAGFLFTCSILNLFEIMSTRFINTMSQISWNLLSLIWLWWEIHIRLMTKWKRMDRWATRFRSCRHCHWVNSPDNKLSSTYWVFQLSHMLLVLPKLMLFLHDIKFCNENTFGTFFNNYFVRGNKQRNLVC